MLNNEEGSNPVISTEIKDAIGKYKNQITDLELEVKRLQKFLVEKTIELSNINDAIKGNEDIIGKLKTDKQERENDVKKLDEEIKVKDDRSKEIEDENKKSEEAISKRETEIKEKEKNLNEKEVDYEKRNVELSESIKNNTADTAEIERKKQIILEVKDKL